MINLSFNFNKHLVRCIAWFQQSIVRLINFSMLSSLFKPFQLNFSISRYTNRVGYLLSLNRKMSSFKAHVTTLSRIVLPLQSSSTSIVKQHWYFWSNSSTSLNYRSDFHNFFRHVAIHSTIALLRKQSTDMSWTRIKNFRNGLF
jgi:hypothetical protein